MSPHLKAEILQSDHQSIKPVLSFDMELSSELRFCEGSIIYKMLKLYFSWYSNLIMIWQPWVKYEGVVTGWDAVRNILGHVTECQAVKYKIGIVTNC